MRSCLVYWSSAVDEHSMLKECYTSTFRICTSVAGNITVIFTSGMSSLRANHPCRHEYCAKHPDTQLCVSMASTHDVRISDALCGCDDTSRQVISERG